MKTKFNTKGAFFALASAIFALASCKKEQSLTSSTTTTSSLATAPTIAVAASANSTSSTDSLYIMQRCDHGIKRDSIAQSALPASVSTYLGINYSGYTFAKAFSLVDSTNTIKGYVVIIYYNNKPVGLLFDASGNFVRVLEQREKGDEDGPGFHDGGRFCDRDGLQKDTIALSALPATITAYFAVNYASDTLVKAFQGKDGIYVVLSKNSGAFATVFSSTGTFIKRVELSARRGFVQPVDQSALPANINSYLSASYSNYVFKKAFVFKNGTTVLGYVVFINANNTRYAVEFDASGNFVKAKAIF